MPCAHRVLHKRRKLISLPTFLAMLEPFQIEQLFAELHLSDAACSLIRGARSCAPVRDIGSQLGNVNVWQFSKKMGGRHLKLESRTVEAAAATLYEFDSCVLEYWAQPVKIDLIFENDAKRRLTRTQYTPDFLLIFENKVVVTEWREESRLQMLAAKGTQFYKDQDHKWHFVSAEEYFNKLGIVYEVHSSLELPHKFVQNVRFLEGYNDPSCRTLCSDSLNRLRALLREQGRAYFLDLISKHGYSADEVFCAVCYGFAYINLHTQRLDMSNDLMVYRDQLIASAYESLEKRDDPPPLPFPGMLRLIPGTVIQFNGRLFTVTIVASGQVFLKDVQQNTVTLALKDVEKLYCSTQDLEVINSFVNPAESQSLADFSEQKLREGIRRLDAIDSNDKSISPRTLQRWKQLAATKLTRVEALISLIPRSDLKGNRTTRISENVEALATKTVETFFNTPECRTVIAAYAKYSVLCADATVVPMSYQTFCKRAKLLSSVAKREGNRKAYQTGSIPLILDYREPVHGVRPHDVCYIDHTIMNIALTGLRGSDLGKPCFTLAIDGHTTQARAFYVSFDPPCARSVLMTLRDYVRRNNRLPKIIVVDGGAEFRSKELEIFCRIFEIDLRHRPPHHPRHGSLVERAMGYTETELLSQLHGNTRILKNVRMVTKSVEPFQFREWTLPALWGALNEFLFYIHDTRPHPSFGLSPCKFEERRILETGKREHKIVRFDSNLLLLTCPHAKHRFHSVDRIRGVWADNSFYWSDEFVEAKLKEKVEVRVEPWNASVIYVCFRGRWITAISRNSTTLVNRSSYELELAIRAERRRSKIVNNSARVSLSASRLRVSLLTASSFDPRIHEQQQEMITLYEGLKMGCAVCPDLKKIADHEASDDSPEIDPSTRSTSSSYVKTTEEDIGSRSAIDPSAPLDSDFWKGNDEYV